MTNNDQHGFDPALVATRLEDWFLEHIAFPVGPGIAHWPVGEANRFTRCSSSTGARMSDGSWADAEESRCQ